MNGTNGEYEQQYLIGVLEKTRSRLLDQTRRNRLLNYKESARDIAIDDEMPDQVFARLVLNGGRFNSDHYEPLAADDTEYAGNARADSESTRTLPNSKNGNDTVEDKYRDDRLQTPFSQKELERRLRRLHLEHRTIIEETGANNLYLAIG